MRAGIDIGGSKIAVQVFDGDWRLCCEHQIATPADYGALLQAVTSQITWAKTQAGPLASVGVGTAGLFHPDTGRLHAANLAAHGHHFAADLTATAGRPLTVIKDSHALALSEAIFGAGHDHHRVASLVLGTGIGGGLVTGGALQTGPTATGGEFGHTALPAYLVKHHDLPIIDCGCGRRGCVETLVAGPGLTRLARHLAGNATPAPEVVARKDQDLSKVWSVWTALAAELVLTLTLVTDPDVIVLGGGLGAAPGVAADLQKAAKAAQFAGFEIARLVPATGGAASGARGAAYAAWQASNAAGA